MLCIFLCIPQVLNKYHKFLKRNQKIQSQKNQACVRVGWIEWLGESTVEGRNSPPPYIQPSICHWGCVITELHYVWGKKTSVSTKSRESKLHLHFADVNGVIMSREEIWLPEGHGLGWERDLETV